MRWLFVIHANDATTLRATLGDLEAVRRSNDHAHVVGRHQLAAECRRSSRTTHAVDVASLGELSDFTHVVVLTDAARVSGNRWLPELLAVAGDDGAAVPSTNGAPWPQCPIDAPTSSASRNDLRDATRRIEQTNRGTHLDVTIAGGPMIVVPTDVFVDACRDGQIATVTSLIEHVVASALPLRVARGAYVHDHTPVLLSACLIMKDELENLPECLASLIGLVDDVVIYDTGSTDGSIELARSFGATVIEGYWDDDFSRARNAALAACRGEWIVHLDADEIIEDTAHSGPVMRELLANATNGDVVAVNLFNLEGSRIAPVRSLAPNLVARFFRRLHCHWRGALHEEPVARPGKPPARYTKSSALTILHSGYLSEAITERDKRARNLRISSVEADNETDADRARFNLARSLLMAHRHAEAIEAFDDIARNCTQDVIRRSSLELGSDALRELGRFDEALEWGQRHSQEFPNLGVGKLLQAKALAMLDRVAEAIPLVEGLTNYNDRYSNVGPDGLAVFTAMAYVHAGRHREALEQVSIAVQQNIRSSHAYVALARVAAEDPDIDIASVLSMVPEQELTSVYAQLLSAPAFGADRIAEAVWAIAPGNLATLAFSSQLAPMLTADRALVWARRLRDLNLAEACPLPSMLDTAELSDRVRFLAVMVDDGDASRAAQLEDQTSRLDDAELSEVFAWVLDNAIGGAESLIVAGATSTARCITISRALAERGHLNEAVAVFGHASALSSSPLPAFDADFERIIRDGAEQIGRRDVVAALDAR
ncbi:MAG: glycosyltransferase [Acidimicrobiia bacterium]